VLQDSATREDLGMLAVLEALAAQEQVTQRELSRRTGLNLKKVNFCLHKLLEKGHVKFQRALKNPDKRSYLYILTPAGLMAKSELTYRFLRFSLGYYNRVEEKLRERLGEMGRRGVRRVVLCGASDAARIVLGLVQGNGIEVVGVLDEGCGRQEFGGKPVVGVSGLQGLGWDGVLITALEDLQGVERRLVEAGVPVEKVWRL
jgi:DNA-binding MarR family transcriptional regulator